ncbi:MAG: VWA domain-containing protein [Lachnospiraceae bacterium]
MEAKQIMSDFVNSVQFDAGDKVELTSFSTGVRLERKFTDDASDLVNCINQLQTKKRSLYDALYTSVERVAAQNGARCVIAFTDGQDNHSNCSRIP